MVTENKLESLKEELVGLELALARLEENKKKIQNRIQKVAIDLSKIRKRRRENIVLSRF